MRVSSGYYTILVIVGRRIGKTIHTVIEWSLNREGSLNDLAAGPRQLEISFRYLSGRMVYALRGLCR